MLGVLELGDAVGFRPHADLSGLPEGRIAHGEESPAVIDDGGLGAPELYPEGMPRARGYFGRHAIGAGRRADGRDGTPAPADNLVRDHVSLEGVGARDIVVAGVAPPPHDAAGLVLTSGDRPEARLHEAVAQRRGRQHGPSEVRSAAIGETGGLFRPARRAASRRSEQPRPGRLGADHAGGKKDESDRHERSHTMPRREKVANPINPAPTMSTVRSSITAAPLWSSRARRTE